MTNPARGDIALTIGGRTARLCLTLGALAELEAAFDCDGLEALGGRLSRMSAADLDTVIRALLRGGGESELASQDAPLAVKPAEAARAAVAAIRAGFA